MGPTDCLLEGELLKLGGPFLQMWQRKHAKLYPNRLEFYNKSRDGQVVKGKEGKGVEVSAVTTTNTTATTSNATQYIIKELVSFDISGVFVAYPVNVQVVVELLCFVIT